MFRLEALQERSQSQHIQCGVEESGVNDGIGVQSVHYIIQIRKLASIVMATGRTYWFQG